MDAPLPNPASPLSLSFVSRLLQTRRRLRNAEKLLQRNLDGSNSAPKVSIMLITYNHDRFVAQALDSILRQKRDFEIEINVIDDASTDGTQAIVKQYQERYPGLINCYFNAQNAGHIATQLNTIRGFQTLRGCYFALLEGDDYWTDDEKLATQVACLDSDLTLVACAHYTQKIFDDNSRPSEHFLPFLGFGRQRATFVDVVNMAAVFHLSSTLYRNVFGLAPPLCLSDPYSCEITINMTYGLFGDFYCLDRYMSAYRVHGTGVFSSQAAERIWLFHLYGYFRFALYLGRRHWMIFIRAMYRFASYVLAAPRKRIVADLALRTRIIFWLSRIAVAPFYLTEIFANRLVKIFKSKPGKRRIGRKLTKKVAKRAKKIRRKMAASPIARYLGAEEDPNAPSSPSRKQKQNHRQNGSK